MAKKIFIPQEIAESGKIFLRENGYEIKESNDHSTDALKRDIADCEAVLSKTLFFPEEVLKAGKVLKVIGKHGVGPDNVVDVATATRLGIYVVNTPTANANSVAEHTIGFIIALAKRFITMDRATREGDFDIPARLNSVELEGKTLGLAGLGRIGTAVAKKAYFGLDMKVKGYDPYAQKAGLPDYIEIVDNSDDIFSSSDFVSLHMPSTLETKGMIDAGKLKLMKPNAYLINCARGNLINEVDLIKTLKSKLIAGAALDVFEDEPPKPNNPLFALPNVILTPHSAALSKEALDRMSYYAAMGIHEVLSGKKPTWPVNSSVSGNI